MRGAPGAAADRAFARAYGVRSGAGGGGSMGCGSGGGTGASGSGTVTDASEMDDADEPEESAIGRGDEW